MSNENQTPASTPESAQNTDKVSPFLTEPTARTAQGQQHLYNNGSDTPVTGSVPKYNLAANTGNVGETTHFGFQTVNSQEKLKKWRKCSIRSPANTTL